MTKARADPSLRAALDSQFRKRSKKIQHTVYSIPKAAVGLSETIFRTFCENGVQAVHERGGGGFHYVHILTYSTRTNNEFTAMAKKLVNSEQPFALGAHAHMLSLTAREITRGQIGRAHV